MFLGEATEDPREAPVVAGTKGPQTAELLASHREGRIIRQQTTVGMDTRMNGRR